MTESSMARDTYYRSGYDMTMERLADADLPTLRAANAAIAEQHERLDYNSREGKTMFGALAAVTDLAVERAKSA